MRRGESRQESVKARQERVKTGRTGAGRRFAGGMSGESILLVAVALAIAVYLLVALIFPERF